MSGSARVNIKTLDFSTRVPANDGVTGAIVIPNAVKGALHPTLVTSAKQLLDRYTVNGKLEVGVDLAYYSALAFLQESNKLWVTRAVTNAAYAGVLIQTTDSLTDNGSMTATDVVDPEAYSFNEDDSFLVYAESPGSWASNSVKTIPNLQIELEDNSAKEPDSFNIKVYVNGILTETLMCSTDPEGYSLDGQSKYIEEVLQSSNYIRAIANPANEGIEPKIVVDERYVFANGDDGDAVDDGAVMLAADNYENVDKYNLRVLLDGGRTTAAYQKHLISIAETRQDCMPILSTPFAASASADYINDILEYRNVTLNANTWRGSLYTSFVKIYDKYTDRELWVAPDGFIGAQVSYTAENREIWFPVAGFNRGVLNVLDVQRHFTKGEMDILYDAGINPIRFTYGKGIVIWGQKTLLGRPSALDRLNVAYLLLYIQPAIAEALDNFLFEINDDITRRQVTALIDSYMANIQGRRGVYGYLVTCDDSNNTPEIIDNNKMNVLLSIQPTKAAEYIDFTTVITRTGVNVTPGEI